MIICECNRYLMMHSMLCRYLGGNMGMFSFVTNRTLPGKAGKDGAGMVKAFVKTGSNVLEGEYTCPECGKSGKINQAFKRPINIICQGCGIIMSLPRLKNEIKKDKKN